MCFVALHLPRRTSSPLLSTWTPSPSSASRLLPLEAFSRAPPLVPSSSISGGGVASSDPGSRLPVHSLLFVLQ